MSPEPPATSGGATTPYYYGPDQLGSVRDVLNAATGAHLAHYDYDAYGLGTGVAYGTVTGTSKLTDYGYAGLLYEATSGISLANYRAYDPQTARWMSRDPIGEAGGINLYRYVSGDPINESDSLGLCGQQPKKKHCPANVQNFINQHLTDAQNIANGMPQGTTAQEVIAVSGAETLWGASLVAPGNYFGINAANGPFPGQTGTVPFIGGQVSSFSDSTGYADSGQVFSNTVSPYLNGPNGTAPNNFFNTIHQHGYGTGTPSYVNDMTKVMNMLNNCTF